MMKDFAALEMSGTACGRNIPEGWHLLQHHCEVLKLAVLYLFMIHVVYIHDIKKRILFRWLLH
jgi:hypothetical protein